MNAPDAYWLRPKKGAPAATAALTYDEVFWMVKNRGFGAALEAGKALLEMPNLSILAVDADVLRKAHELAAAYKPHARDAIHATCALVNGMRTVVYGIMKEIERKAL